MGLMVGYSEINLTMSIGAWLAEISWTQFLVPALIFAVSQIWISTQLLPLASQLRGLSDDLDLSVLSKILPILTVPVNALNNIRAKINDLADGVMKMYWAGTRKNLKRLAIGSFLSFFPWWIKGIYWTYCGVKVVNFFTQLISVVLPIIKIIEEIARAFGIEIEVNIYQDVVANLAKQCIRLGVGGIPFLNKITSYAVVPADNVASFRNVIQTFKSGDIAGGKQSFQFFKNELNEDYKDILTIL